jgi:hypothetical protein
MKRLSFKAALAMSSLALAAFALPMPAAADEDLSKLQEQLRNLKQRVEALDAEKARRATPAAALEVGNGPRSIKLPGTNTSLQIGGFAHLHVMWDFSGGGAGQQVTDPGSVASPVNPAVFAISGSQFDNRFNGGHWRLNAAFSRIFITTSTPTDWGELRTWIEADFLGTVSQFLRLRAAYGSLGPVAAGQMDSLFRSSWAEADTVDPGGVPGTPGGRVPSITYSHNFGSGWVAHIGIEDPFDALLHANCPGAGGAAGACAVNGTAVRAGQRFPELVVAVEHNWGNGRAKIAGLFKQLEADSGGVFPAGADRTFGWGFAAAVAVNVRDNVLVALDGFLGEGVGRQAASSGFVDAVFLRAPGVSGGSVRPIWTWGGSIWVQWRATPTVRFNAAYSYAISEADNELAGTKGERKGALSTPEINHYVWSAFGNVIWSPVPLVDFGLEYAYLFDSVYNSANAYSSRISLGFRYRF